MSATQDAKNWFVLLKGKRYGPYTFAAIVQAAEKGVVDHDAGVWCLGWDEWRIARDVPGLFKDEPASEVTKEDVDAPAADAVFETDAEEPKHAEGDHESDRRDERRREFGDPKSGDPKSGDSKSGDSKSKDRKSDDRTSGDRDLGRREGRLRDLDLRDLSLRDLGLRDPGQRGPGLRRPGETNRGLVQDEAKKDDHDRADKHDEANDRGKDAVDAAALAGAAAEKPLAVLGRLSDLSEMRVRARATDEADAEPEEGAALDVAADSPIPKPVSPSLGERPRSRGGAWLAIFSVIAVLAILSGVVWAAIALGIIRVEFMPKQSRAASAEKPAAALQALPSGGAPPPALPRTLVDGVPEIVAAMPAVAALKSADPDAYAKFLKRFTATYQPDAADDETLTRARTALRKSMKHLLAKATTESLLEITEVNLAYMRALQKGNPGSCVALSDESKGAALDSNLARDFPPLFEREMAVLQRIVATAGNTEPAPSEADVRAYLETVFGEIKKQPVQTQLLGRDKLTPAEYAPYCDLVIAFYEAVRALPFADAVKLLRNLYATAAAEPDTDLR
jgi:GYF domain 2